MGLESDQLDRAACHVPARIDPVLQLQNSMMPVPNGACAPWAAATACSMLSLHACHAFLYQYLALHLQVLPSRHVIACRLRVAITGASLQCLHVRLHRNSILSRISSWSQVSSAPG